AVAQRQRRGQEGNGIQLREREDARQRPERDRSQQERLAEAGPEHHRRPPEAVDDDAGHEAEHERRQQLGRAEHAHLAGGGAQGQHRDQRDRELADLRPRVGEELCGPEDRERPVAPERERFGCHAAIIDISAALLLPARKLWLTCCARLPESRALGQGLSWPGRSAWPCSVVPPAVLAGASRYFRAQTGYRSRAG